MSANPGLGLVAEDKAIRTDPNSWMSEPFVCSPREAESCGSDKPSNADFGQNEKMLTRHPNG
jgi:hypothetical protein